MEEQPYVLILGWAGSQEKQLRPLAKWYSSQGFQTRCFTLQARSYLLHPRGIEAYTNEFSKTVLRELGNTQRPWLVHLFSNNGFAALGGLLHAFRREGSWNITTMLQGIIMDSAPYFTPHMSAWQGANAYARGITAMACVVLPVQKKTAHSLVLPGLCSAFWIRFLLQDGGIRYLRKMADTILDTNVPTLLLAGGRDDTVPLKYIRMFAEDGQARGVHFEIEVFDADHVQLLFKHREAYFETVRGFLQRNCSL